MNRRQKIVQEQFLNNEKEIIDRLKEVYSTAQRDINRRIAKLMKRYDPETGDLPQSAIYQLKHQQMLKAQVDDILNNLQTKEYATIAKYLDDCYTDSFIGNIFDLHGQGIPLVFPIDQEAVIQAVQTNSKISNGLYTRLGEDVTKLKRAIMQEVSRSVVNGDSFHRTARNLTQKSRIGYNNAIRIARTEGGRVQNTAAFDVAMTAKKQGADIVKQWNATLDGKTRASHAMVDMEIRELDEPFSNGLMHPHDPAGTAKEVVNCRCCLNQRARWALEGSFTKMNGFSGELEEFESAEDYNEFKTDFFSNENRNYMNYVQEMYERYHTNDYEKMLASLNDQEYKHFRKLLEANPVYKKKG